MKGDNKLMIRAYHSLDSIETIDLIKDTIKSVNSKDYQQHQINTWADIDPNKWEKSVIGHDAIVAMSQQQIVGFADMDDTGYLDRLYVHKDFQGKGIATKLVATLESNSSSKKFTTYASITAKPFFEYIGYHVVQENIALLGEVEFMNYLMEKIR